MLTVVYFKPLSFFCRISLFPFVEESNSLYQISDSNDLDIDILSVAIALKISKNALKSLCALRICDCWINLSYV